jgi:hypothetical protein
MEMQKWFDQIQFAVADSGIYSVYLLNQEFAKEVAIEFLLYQNRLIGKAKIANQNLSKTVAIECSVKGATIIFCRDNEMLKKIAEIERLQNGQ